jgi:ketosteroid isomerase-like protein
MPPVDDATRREFERLEDGLQDALMQSQLDYFEEHWEPDATYVHLSGGVDDRASFIERLRSKATVYFAREIDEVIMHRHGDTVVVTGRSNIDIAVRGTRKVLDTRFTRVYVQTEGAWRFVANQSGANTANAAPAPAEPADGNR